MQTTPSLLGCLCKPPSSRKAQFYQAASPHGTTASNPYCTPLTRAHLLYASPCPMRTSCALQSGILCAYTEALLPAEPRPCFQQEPHAPSSPTHIRPPLSCTNRRLPPELTPFPTTDLSREPSGGARRPRGPVRTLGVEKPRRGDRGRGRRTPGRPHSGAAEAAAATPGSGLGPGARPEPTTSRLPWFALQPPRAAPPQGPPVGCETRHSEAAALLLGFRPPLRSGRHCPLVKMVMIPPLSSMPVVCVPPCFYHSTTNPSDHCVMG